MKGSKLSDGMELALPLFLIALAELLIFLGHLKAGLAVHGCNLLFLAGASAYVEDRAYQAFMLLPLFRLLNIAMPVFFSLSLYSYVLVYAPMFLPIALLVKNRVFTLDEIGVKVSGMELDASLGVAVGLLLGWIEYQVIRPEMLTPDNGVASFLLLSVIMIFFVGFVEEFVFRSSLQTVLMGRLGTLRGLIVASVIFGFMHSGYHLATEMAFVMVAGLVFGLLFIRTRSLPAVSLSHGVTNISLFMITPLYQTRLLPLGYILAICLLLIFYGLRFEYSRQG